jgi:hypothetical protein
VKRVNISGLITFFFRSHAERPVAGGTMASDLPLRAHVDWDHAVWKEVKEMVSIPVLMIFLAVVTVYLSGCLVYHVRDIHDERKDQNGSSRRSAPRHGGSHVAHP